MTHILEVTTGDFQSIKEGKKTILIIKDERGYQVDDNLVIQGFDAHGTTGKTAEMTYKINFLADEQTPGIKKGFCVIEIKEKE